ncbi:MAG: ATP-dependent Clp protease proteolytic subunit [Bacteroidia bacterium]|nr:ATP-dependent Clp protease proteolytic subunit [Bacteroidia bacterium]
MESFGWIWLVIIFLSLLPTLQQRLRYVMRVRLIQAIEKEQKSRVITIVHRQEAFSFLGIPFMKFLNLEDSEEVLRALELTDSGKQIDLILHTPGGLVIAALQIARAMQNRKGKVRVIVPHYAMSGGTLLALAADEIIMSPNAVLGPVDPQIDKYPAPSILRILDLKDKNEIDDETIIKADMAKKAIQQLRDALQEILSHNYDPEFSKALADKLTSGKWTHDFPITVAFATELGLNVNTEVPKGVFELMRLYKQPIRRQRTVDYAPN